ncbi:MAG TPA: DUF4349 domain-containing protein [Gemmatimonadales bacterium]
MRTTHPRPDRTPLPRLRRALLATAALALGAAGCSTGSDSVADPGRSATFDAATGSAEPAAAPAASYSVQKVAPEMATQSNEAVPPPSPEQAGTSGSSATQGGSVAANAMLIRTGSASVEVEDVDRGIAQLRQLATRLGGYVANSSLQGGADQVRAATLELKIPAARFDEAVSGLEPLGDVENVNVSAEDVGEEFTDVTARVENARRLEERLLALLAQRTGKLEDVLAVERELARVREQIERYEGRLRYLRTRVATSTLTVTVHEPYPLVGGRPGTSPIAEAFRQAWRNFVGFVAGFIASLGVLVPLALIVAVVVWAGRRLFGWRLPRRSRPAPGGEVGSG